MQSLWLKQRNYDIFDLFLNNPKEPIDTTDSFDFRLQFTMNLSGDIDGVQAMLETGLKPIVFSKVIEGKPISVAELQKYAGDYDLAGMTVKVYVKDNKTLYVLVPGQPDYEMVALGNDKFALKVLSGYYLQFGPAGAAKITEATFIQPNGSFKAVRK